MEKTKKQLEEEIIILKKENQDWLSSSLRKRKEFAKAFGWQKPNSYQNGIDKTEPSWEEIFVEIGRLLATRDFRDFEGNISELECGLEDLRNKIKKEIHPGL